MSEIQSILTAGDTAELGAVFGERARFNQPLGPATWWKIGGPADAYIEVESAAELEVLLGFCRRRRLSWFVLGNGSNILVGDGGMRGIVIRLTGAFAEADVRSEDGAVVVQAGGAASLALVTGQAASRGALGVDGLAGVPATIGGAVRMNAGTEREIGEFVQEVTVQTLSRPQPHAAHVQYLYRRSTLAPDAIVTGVRLHFAGGDPAEVRTALQQRLVRRKATQPVGLPNAGSCFRNPPNDRAGRLIEAAGAKGWREGDAEVSQLHANFIVNHGAARAEDVAALLARVRAAVLEQFGVELELEVHFVGVFTSIRDARPA